MSHGTGSSRYSPPADPLDPDSGPRVTREQASVEPLVVTGPADAGEGIGYTERQFGIPRSHFGGHAVTGDLLDTIVHEALGEASMCWTPTPTGVFDSTRAAAIGRRTVGLVRAFHSDPHPFMFSSEDGECGVCGDGIGAHTHYLDTDMETCRPVDEDERTDYAERNPADLDKQCDEAWDVLTRPRMSGAVNVAGPPPPPVLIDRLLELVRTLGYDVERFRASDRDMAGALYQSQADLTEALRALRWATQRHPDDAVLDKIAERMSHAYPRSID